MLSDRRRRVLDALVKEYVRSAQPVASQHLVDRYDLRVSPATVRSELAVLEESGLVFQPHVSAGRVPTDSGYRSFVSSILEDDRCSALTPEEVEEVHGRCEAFEHEIAEAMRETSAMLSRLTSYVAVVIAPVLKTARVKRIDLVSIGQTRAVVVVVTDTGQVADRMIDLFEAVSAEQLRAVEHVVNGALDGRTAEGVRSARLDLERMAEISPRVATQIVDEVLECLMEADSDRIVTGGVPSLLAQPEFSDPRLVGPLLQLLEDGLSTLQVLTDLMVVGDVAVRIGADNPLGLDRLSVVAANYDAGGTEGVVGVIGPTRMDYPRAVSAVRTVADGLTEALG